MPTWIRAAILAPLRLLNAALPESDWKNAARAWLLRHRNALPRELMIRRGDTVLQVGMWRKENLARLSRCAGPGGRVILIEADPGVASTLTAYAAERGFENLTIVNKGAFNRKGKQIMNAGTSPTFNRLDGTGVTMMREDFDSAMEIDVDTVDNILAEFEVAEIDYAEITVNGVELQVLQGMEQTAQRTKRVFLAGYARTLETDQPTNRSTRNFLRQRGFRTTVSKRVLPSRIKSADLATVPAQRHLEGHVFAWRR